MLLSYDILKTLKLFISMGLNTSIGGVKYTHSAPK